MMVMVSGSRDLFCLYFSLAVRVNGYWAQKMLHKVRVSVTSGGVRNTTDISKRASAQLQTQQLIIYLPMFIQPLPLPGSGGTKMNNSWSLLTKDHGIAKSENSTKHDVLHALSSPQEQGAVLSTSHRLRYYLIPSKYSHFLREET